MAKDAEEKSSLLNPQLVSTVSVMGAVFLLRKGLSRAWTKITGKNPPTDLTDPEVTLGETLIWAVATGVIVETARYFMVRGTARLTRQEPAKTE